MKNAVILSLCFLPLTIIFIVMKVSLWFSSSINEIKYVKEDAKQSPRTYLENVYADVDEEDEKD